MPGRRGPRLRTSPPRPRTRAAGPGRPSAGRDRRRAPGSRPPGIAGQRCRCRSRRPARRGRGWRRRSAPQVLRDSWGGPGHSVRRPGRTTPPPAGADEARSLMNLVLTGLRAALAYTNDRLPNALMAAGFAPGREEAEGADLTVRARP